MRKLIFSAVILISVSAGAQNNTASNIVEGGKTLVELVRVFKTPKSSMLQPVVEKTDSCKIKSISDLCIKNSTGKPLLVSVSKRNGNAYETAVLTIKVLAKSYEWIYELKSGIYKLKLETEESGLKKIFQEGEIKLNACENLIKEIKNE